VGKLGSYPTREYEKAKKPLSSPNREYEKAKQNQGVLQPGSTKRLKTKEFSIQGVRKAKNPGSSPTKED
jgi:hypothetical protein